MDDSDLSGLDLRGAKAYMLDFVTSGKLLKKDLVSLDAEIRTWGSRVTLAEGKGMLELATAAKAKLAELVARRDGLVAEAAELDGKVLRIREKLPGIAARERSIDADRLLAELQLMAGTLLDEGGSGLEESMRKLENDAAADASLAALKGENKAGNDEKTGAR
ncbi:MAG: chromosome partitioning protein [Spirochaetota bacterium]